jgi:hypothetical protein
MTYTLTVNELQLQQINNACDLVSRLYMGQWDTILELFRVHSISEAYDSIDMRDKLNALAMECGLRPSLNGYNGILSDEVDDKARILWDLNQVIRYRLAWDRSPQGGLGVNFDKPFHSCKDVPLAKVEKKP